MEDFSYKKVSIICLIIFIIIVLFYGLTNLIIDKKNNKEEVKPENYTTIQYDEIIVGNIFKQKENEYYVLALIAKDENKSKYESSLQTYNSNENSIKTYTIDLDSGFNKKYVSDSSNFEGNLPIFSQSTLLKISDSQIVEIYEGEDITSVLK